MKNLAGLTAALLLVACASATSPTLQPTPTPASTSTETATSLPRLRLRRDEPSPSASATPAPSASTTPTATASGGLSPAEIRYLLIDKFGPLHYCDPDEYPVAHGDEQQKAIAQFPADRRRRANARRHLASGRPHRPDDVLRRRQAAHLPRVEGAQRRRRATVGQRAVPVRRDERGRRGERRGDALPGHGRCPDGPDQHHYAGAGVRRECPICLARGTLIATPNGPVAVDQLQPGDPIWTTDASGKRVASVVVQNRLGAGAQLAPGRPPRA